MNYKYYIIYKPYRVLSQFTSTEDKKCLKDFFSVEKDVYPVGRLDYDSEGLLILTNDAKFNYKLLHPKFVHEREYLVQADGVITENALRSLSKGVTIHIDGKPYCTQPCRATALQEAPDLPDRDPPIRFRKSIPTCWVSIVLTEGKNRQVRKMMANVGFPVLRLIRTRIEQLTLHKMRPGNMIALSHEAISRKLFGK
ncbi:MAG: pseudouridine synthase [Chitinophagaceae bacterium]|nr:pseudouridine synthase [Chitinophagaceae bacterium]